MDQEVSAYTSVPPVVEGAALTNVMVKQVLGKIEDPLSRFVFKLIEVEGWTPEETADYVEIPTQQVFQRVNQAKQMLRIAFPTPSALYG